MSFTQRKKKEKSHSLALVLTLTLLHQALTIWLQATADCGALHCL